MDVSLFAGPLLLVPLLAWIGAAVLTAWLASELDRPGGIWLILGFLLGPIALVAVGFAGRPRRGG